MAGRVVAALLFFAMFGAPASVRAAETQRIGGDGGSRTVNMDCGAGSFIVGVVATGGKDFSLAPNIVRKLRFRCRTYDGTTFGTTTTLTTEAVADAPAKVSISSNSVTCESGNAIFDIDLNAGTYIDRISSFTCVRPTSGSTNLNFNVGGDGGNRQVMHCPLAEALYKVEARVGSSIDSLKGYCRAFGPLEDADALTQMNATRTPKPTNTSPVKIMPRRAASFTFTVPPSGVNQRFVPSITAQTDLLGGGSLNPPDYRMELLNPTGGVLATRNVSGNSVFLEGIAYTFNAAGTWTLRVTNLKQDIGALDVIAFKIILP
jgi:hypothetical protein